ncbi:MAG: IS91 family transposase [Polyangiaceae bacterium]|nr:IS91 family transposase [Polyangiaceae bacterium]
MTSRPAPAGRPLFDIADIVRAHRGELEAESCLSPAQRQVLSAIELCRTAALGGHLDVCRSCGHQHPAYNSCRNRHCPKCQALRQEQWIAARAARLLPVRHFHVVFTLPRELRSLAKALPRPVLDALFSAASGTLSDLGSSRLAATLGITMVLHTWTRDLRFHPHVHALVTAGGLAHDRKAWVRTDPSYLFPVTMMGTVFRAKMLACLHRLHEQGVFASFDELRDPRAFDRLMARLARVSWVVFAKKPFRRPDHVLRYLGRYTHRVAISNSRFTAVTNDAVTFRTKHGKSATLHPLDFLRRFVQHVLPDGFHKIRHYGLYAGTAVADALPAARSLLAPNTTPPTNSAPPTWRDRLCSLTGRDVDRCRVCGALVDHLPLASCDIRSRAPPLRRAA